MVAFFSLILVGIPSAAVADDDSCCKTPGYYKNHPDKWPVTEITIGGVTYSKTTAIDWIKSSVQGDKRITMFKALVAAKLNVLSDCDPCDIIAGTIDAADGWFASYGLAPVPASSDAWQEGECLYVTLDIYNNTCQYIDVCNFCD